MNEPMPGGGTIATYQDITEAERHEQRLQEYTQKLERSNKELENFAYVASHDLQEPLRKIEAFSDRLVRKYADQMPDEGKMFMDRMQNAAQRMRRLINDLLDFSRVSTKTSPLIKTNLDKVLADVLSDLQVRIEESGAEVVAGEIGAIEADATQMRQLLQNLIGNALKFRTPERTPRVTVSAERHASIEGLLDGATPAIVISITDNGIGFENKYKEQIFKIFQRLHGRQEYEGTGIGLATCRKIVDRHNGILDADGRPGEGATFMITLPLTQPAAT
jgi:light-regulated signal transduction histidine kinase (bacteriophytochrome)